VTAARELNGQEQPVGAGTVKGGELVTSFSAYQPRTFAVKLAKPHSEVAEPVWKPVTLVYDASVATRDGKPGEGCFDCDYNQPDSPQGKALPAEMLPAEIAYGGIRFHLAPAGGGNPDAMTARGQTIHLPPGKFNRLYLLAASYDGDQTSIFQVESSSTVSRVDRTIEDWGGFIGQWDTRTWNEKTYEVPTPPEPAADDHSPRAERARRFRAYIKEHGPIIRTVDEYTGLKPGYIKRAPVAWFASHNHAADGSNEAYSYSYLFAYEIDLPPGATALTLPNNPRIRILAATVADERAGLRAAEPLYDTLDRKDVDMKRWNTGIASATQPPQEDDE
jgi:alpha-mannosidase